MEGFLFAVKVILVKGLTFHLYDTDVRRPGGSRSRPEDCGESSAPERGDRKGSGGGMSSGFTSTTALLKVPLVE